MTGAILVGAAGSGGLLANPTIWVAVALIIFLGLVFWKGFRPMLQALDARAERIRAEIDEAQELREEAQKALAEYKRKQRDALKEAEEIVDNAGAESKRMRERSEHELEEALKRRERQAMEKIEQAEQSAVREVRNQAVGVAMVAARQLMEKAIDKDKAEEMIQESIDDLPKRLQ
ncbi:MAG: ATP F0F1 synthase subunit B [Rhodovibrionaceae bacterium]|nr:ATP F0F1 synthase subunit B [Rhodovibrionaceae bacterium]